VRISKPHWITLQITPDRTVKNSEVSTLVKAFHELYAVPLQRISFNHGLSYQLREAVFWRLVYEPGCIRILLTLPERWKDYVLQKINSVWPKVPVKQVNTDMNFDPTLCDAAEVYLRQHWLFSLNTHPQLGAPYPSILEPIRDMKGSDQAEIRILLKPVSDEWQDDWEKAYEKYRQGKIKRQTGLQKDSVIYRVAEKADKGFQAAENGIAWALRAENKKKRNSSEDIVHVLLDALNNRNDEDEISQATLKKGRYKAYEVTIYIVSQSEDKHRRKLTARSLATSFQDLNQDQEFTYKWINPTSTLKVLQEFKIQDNSKNILSVPEVCRLVQLPTAGMQADYPELISLDRREVSLPTELFHKEGIPIGAVTEKNITRIARRPIRKYHGVEQKHVFDALCTPEFDGGKMGTGKTGNGIVQAIEFVKNGFTAFVMDTADGQGIRELEDALPEDFPDQKLIHIDLDNKAWPVALNWGDILGRQLAKEGDQELEALEVSERITNRLVEFVGNMASSEFTDRMKQYLVACCRAVISSKPDWSFLDVELALKSPTYREELLKHPEVQNQPEIYDDLMTLQAKAESDGIRPIIDPILSRLKMLSNSRFLANMFMQPAKLDCDGKPLLDFRRLMDNPEGGYGYLVCLHASADAWGEDGQELTLGFLTDKINLAAFSRVDVTQSERKPVLSWVDEPHKVIKKTARYFQNGAVEFRKYRIKLLFSGHSISQMGPAANALKEGGCQFTWYKTENVKAFEELKDQFAPFDPDELYSTLPEKWEAVNKVRLPSGHDCPAFIAKMVPPPLFVRSRENRRQECARQFGRHWKEVYGQIQELRLKYQKLDEEWYNHKILAAQLLKEAEKQAEREAREAAKQAKKVKKNA
jgi:hypothetical protein